MRGGYVSPACEQTLGTRRRALRLARPGITSREREVLILIAGGQCNKRMALRICVKTVEKHRANLMRKLELHNVVDRRVRRRRRDGAGGCATHSSVQERRELAYGRRQTDR